MRFALVVLGVLAATALVGCGKSRSEIGNFANVDSVELVRDAASALAANYPPAKTRLSLSLAAEDAFGSELVETLRANGYAVAEYVEPAGKDKYLPGLKKPDGLAFAYVIDDREDELRVSLRVGDERLSRMYRVQRSGETLQYIPQGFWTRGQ